MKEQDYRLGIGLSVIPYIGPDLYSNVPAVISELIANAWDAGATKVEITIDLTNDFIVIEDNGAGMSFDDINSKYLHIGHKKRVVSNTTFTVNGKARHVMGRKGIGKLAPFALAEELEIQSVKGDERSGFTIEWENLKSAIDSDALFYTPPPLDTSRIAIQQGTRFTLRTLKPDKLNSLQDIIKLRKQIARRFTIIHSNFDFEVVVNGKPILDEDKSYLSKLEFLWLLNEEQNFVTQSCKNLLRPPIFINDQITVQGKNYQIGGWIGTVQKPSDIKADDNDTIAIFAHGKLIQEDILSEIGEKQVFGSYLVGNIEADFLDDDTDADIVTPDRQRLNQSDPRYVALRLFIQEVMRREIRDRWSLWRLERPIKEVLEKPQIATWYTQLSSLNNQDTAVKLIKKIFELPVDDNKKNVYYGLLVEHFEKLKKTKDKTKEDLMKELEKYISDYAQQSGLPISSSAQNTKKTGESTPKNSDNQKGEAQKPASQKENVDKEKQKTGGSPASSPKSQDPEPDASKTNTTASTSVTESSTPETTEQSKPSAEQGSDETGRQQNSKAPKNQALHHFSEIEKLIKNLNIEDSFKTIALFDLNESQIAFNNTAYKACIVMLGAVLEGVMLATLRRQDVLQKITNLSPGQYPSFWGSVTNPTQPFDAKATAEKISNDTRIGFNEYKQALTKLIPDLENSKIENIQHFRNSIHPYKAIKEPNTFGNPTLARAILYLSSLEILVKHIASSIP